MNAGKTLLDMRGSIPSFIDGFYTRRGYPDQLRRVRLKDPETGKILVFITNQMTLPSAMICVLYPNRW